MRRREGRVLKNSWPNMRRKESLKNRRGIRVKLRIRSRDIVSNRILIHVKVIMLLRRIHLVNRLLHGFGRILAIIYIWIIIGWVWNHILFNILLYIRVVTHHKDQLLLAIIWSERILIAARKVRRTWVKIQNTYSKGGVPQAYLILKKEDCNECAIKS